MARMQAAVVERPGEGLRMMEVARPEPGPGEVLIRVAACGVCHSDGRRPCTLRLPSRQTD